MNRECRKTREDIERSVFAPLAREQQDEIDRHVGRCEACRAYFEAMRADERALDDFARSFDPSVERIEAESIRAAASGVVPEAARSSRDWRGIMKPRIAVYAAAAVALIAVLWGINHFTGLFGGKPAFADVMAKIAAAEYVSYHKLLKLEGVGEFASENMATDRGVLRWTSDGGVDIIDFNKGITLSLNPATKTAFLTHRLGAPSGTGLFNYVDWIAKLQNAPGGRFTGRQKLGGREANVFEVTLSEFSSIKVWTDPKTNLPLRIAWTNRSNPELDVAQAMLTLSEDDFGGDSRFAQSIVWVSSNGMQPSSEEVYDDFKWNVKVDSALFSVTPPEGYDVREWVLDVSENGEKDLVEALSAWAEMSGKEFPASIADLANPEEVRTLLIQRFNRSGDPRTELDEAMKEANVLLKGLTFSQGLKAQRSWHYAGAGVKLGEKNKPVCWWKPEGSAKYRILYGDLRVTDIDEAHLPKKPR
jgi:outer membrane lipoprotein-sorting protein